MTGSAGSANDLPGEALTRREREVLALLAEGLTGPEIAARLTLATSSVKSHIQHLYGKLGVSSKRQAVVRGRELGLLGTPTSSPALAVPTPPSTPAHPLHNLPPVLTRFFGREAEIAQLVERLADWRLVTLTGPGGVGKTRLALRITEKVADDYPDGIWLVELASLLDSAQVALTVASSLGVTEQPGRPIFETLVSYLRNRLSLLLLDNCEHLLEACAQLADALLRSCPRLTILVTSREPLGISGEGVYLVPSLAYPDTQRLPDLELLQTFSAFSLFVDRTRAVLPGYDVSSDDARFVARICQRLDGIPLALELAAARMHILSAAEMARRLDDVFRLLTSGSRTALPRQQTLRATIDWSYELLREGERLLLQRLSVFVGGCTLEAAEAVCSGEGIEANRVLEILAALVDKSMVVATRRAGEETRYHLLEMVRQYAREKLDAEGGSHRLARRHWEYFLHFADANGCKLWTKERRAWITRFEADFENVRLALHWSYSGFGESEAGLRLTVAMQPYWFIREWGESRRWMAKGITQYQNGAVINPALQANFLAWASANRWCAEWSRDLAEQSLAISRRLGPEDEETLCWSLWIMAVAGCYLEISPEDWARSESLLDEQDAIIPHLGSESKIAPQFYRGYNLWLRAVLANYRGQHKQARTCGLESVKIFESDFHAMHLVLPYNALGDTALRTGDYDQAYAYFADALRLAEDGRDIRYSDTLALLCEVELRRGKLAEAFEYCKAYLRLGNGINPHSLMLLETAARIFARADRYAEAARLSGAAEALSEKIGRKISSNTAATSYWGDWRTRCGDLSLEALVPDWHGRADRLALQGAWNEGRSMTFEQAQSYALNDLVI